MKFQIEGVDFMETVYFELELEYGTNCTLRMKH